MLFQLFKCFLRELTDVLECVSTVLIRKPGYIVGRHITRQECKTCLVAVSEWSRFLLLVDSHVMQFWWLLIKCEKILFRRFILIQELKVFSFNTENEKGMNETGEGVIGVAGLSEKVFDATRPYTWAFVKWKINHPHWPSGLGDLSWTFPFLSKNVEVYLWPLWHGQNSQVFVHYFWVTDMCVTYGWHLSNMCNVCVMCSMCPTCWHRGSADDTAPDHDKRLIKIFWIVFTTNNLLTVSGLCQILI